MTDRARAQLDAFAAGKERPGPPTVPARAWWPPGLDLRAPVPTYGIDRIILGCAKSKRYMEGDDRLIQSTAWRFRYSFNLALLAAERAVPAEKEFKNAKNKAELFFEKVRRFNHFINETDIEDISRVALPVAEKCYVGDDDVQCAVNTLREAVVSFLATVEIPCYLMNAGNRDLFTSSYIEELAQDFRLDPFVPVTAENWKDFARLISAGWEDLGLPRTHGSSKSYQTVYGWLSDRVRTQFGFR